MTDANQLPYPIAHVYAESLRTDVDDGILLDNTVATYSALLRFVALTLVSQFLAGRYDPIDTSALEAAKMIGVLRFPTLGSLYTAINSLRKFYLTPPRAEKLPYVSGGVFSQELLQATVKFKNAKAGGRPLHDVISDIRNAYIGHPEGSSTQKRRAVLDEIRPLVYQALETFAEPLSQLALVSRDRSAESTLRLLRGPGLEFPTQPILNLYVDSLFERNSLLILHGDDALPMFPMLIADVAIQENTPALSFDGFRTIVEESTKGKQVKYEVLKYIHFHGHIYRREEFDDFRDLILRHNVGLYLDKERFEPWTLSDWAAISTRINLTFLAGTKYFPEYYEERPGVEDRIRRWLDAGAAALLVSGDAGYGKTSLFCRIAAELVGVGTPETVEDGNQQHCVALVLGGDVGYELERSTAADLNLESGQRPVTSLFDRLCLAIGVAPWSPTSSKKAFRDFADLLQYWQVQRKRDLSPNRKLVILLDAANEARQVREVLAEVSDLAKAAHAVNAEAGQAWVRMLVSVRSVHYAIIADEAGVEGEQRLLASESSFAQFEGRDGKPRRYLELPEFGEEAARRAYERRAQVPDRPRCEVKWADLPEAVQTLLRQPLLIEIFHAAFAGASSPLGLPVIEESQLWRRWFDNFLCSGSEDRPLREFVLTLAEECLRRGEAVIGREIQAAVETHWDQRATSRERAAVARAELSLFERLIALGTLRQRPDGAAEWRAQLLGEYVAFEAVKRLEVSWNELVTWPEGALLTGTSSLLFEDCWRADRMDALAGLSLGGVGAAAARAALRRLAPLGVEKAIREELERYEAKVRTLVEKARDRTSAALMVWEVFEGLVDRVGGRPAARRLLEVAHDYLEVSAKREPDNTTYLHDLWVSYVRLGDLDCTQGAAQSRARYEQALGMAERLARLEPDHTTYLHDLSISYSRLGDLDSNNDVARARGRYMEALAIMERLAKLVPDETTYLHGLSITYAKLGSLDCKQDAGRARAWYERELAIDERLAQLEPGNSTYLLSLSSSYVNLGDLDRTQEVKRARTRYEQALAIRERLAQQEPYNSTYLRALSLSYDDLGNLDSTVGEGWARARFEQALAIRERLARQEPDNTTYLRDLSVSYNKLGDLDRTQEVERARTRYEEALAILERLAQQEPKSTTYLRDLATSYDHLGNLDCTQDVERARTRYEQALNIRQRLAQQEPYDTNYLRDLSVSYQNLGNLDRTRDVGRARARCEQALAIRERLTKQEPNNTTYLGDLSISYDHLGNLDRVQDVRRARARYEQALAIQERLALKEPDNTAYLRDLSIAYSRLGDLDRTHDEGRARAWYELELAIAERLAQQEPENTTYLHDLAISYDHLGDLESTQEGWLRTWTGWYTRYERRARGWYEQGLAIRERLVQQEPENNDRLRSLAVSYYKLGALERITNRIFAYTLLQKGLAIVERLAKIDPENLEYRTDATEFRSLLEVPGAIDKRK